MRVLVVIQGPVFGGAHNQIVKLREPLANLGVDVQAVLPESGEEAAARMRATGLETSTISIARLRASPDPRLHLRLLCGLSADVRRLRKLIADAGIDVVQVHGVTNPQGAIAARRSGAGVTWQLFDTRAPMTVRRVAMPAVNRLADSMTTWGEGLADEHPGARNLGERRLTVFPPVDMASFAPDPGRREQARAELGVQSDECLIGTVGVRNPQKGHDQFVRAAALIAADHQNARFRVLGAQSPSHRPHMREVEADAKRLGLDDPILRFVDPAADVPRLLQAFDIFVMSSVPRSEGMPTAILEAMSCAKPVVATDVGATGELVEDGVTGWVVPPLDAVAICRATSKLLSDPPLRQSMGEAGLARAKSRFDIDGLAAIHAHAFAIANDRARRRGSR